MGVIEKTPYKVWTKEGGQELTRDEWFKFDNSALHRVDGPAVEFSSGEKWWFINGNPHRTDGPALEGPVDGMQYWIVNGKQLNTEKIEEWIDENNIDLKSEEGEFAFTLRWS